jgi:hypothetical protein
MNTPPPSRFLPRVELLEERCTPSASVNFSNHVLRIVTDAPYSIVSIHDNGHGHVSAEVQATNGTVSKAGDQISHIELQTPRGRNIVSYSLTDTLFSSQQLDFNLGKGFDTVNLGFSRGVAAPRLGINVTGGWGQEQVNTYFGDVKNTDVETNVQLGTGPSVFRGTLAGKLLGNARVNFNVRGGADVNMMDIKSTSDIAATASLAINLQGGPEGDGMWFTYQGRMDGKLTYQARGGNNDDLIEATIGANNGSKGSVVANINSTRGSNYLRLRVNTPHPNTLRRVDATITARQGADYVVTTPNVKVTRVRA